MGVIETAPLSVAVTALEGDVIVEKPVAAPSVTTGAGTELAGSWYMTVNEDGSTGPVDPGVDPSSVTRVMSPWAATDWSKVPIGSGLTYIPTTDPKHVKVLSTFSGSKGVINYKDWTDAVFVSKASDPKMRIEHWDSLNSTLNTSPRGQEMPYSDPAGAFVKAYDDVPIPSSATWWGSNNTDRKVIVVNGDPVTFQGTTYPAYTLVVEIHKFVRIDDGLRILSTNLAYNDLRGSGLTRGAIASGISAYYGVNLAWEIDRAVAGDPRAFDHVLRLGTNNGKLKRSHTAKWPARTVDGDSGSAYSTTGQAEYGDHLSLPADFDPDTKTIDGQPLTNVQKAYVNQWRYYGGVILIRTGPKEATVDGPIYSYIEGSDKVNTTAAAQMAVALNTLIVPNLRIASNYNLTSAQYNSTTRVPNDPSLIAGGGTRRVERVINPA